MDDSSGSRRTVTGQSPTGNVQEAFDDAVRQLGHGARWRLHEIEGQKGGTVGNHLNVHIHVEHSAT